MVDVRIHTGITLPIALLIWYIYRPESLVSVESFVIISTLFTGAFMDIDHTSGWEYIKGLINGNLKVPTEQEWTNWMHTKLSIVVVVLVFLVLSYFFGPLNLVPILAYFTHIGIDGFNRANLKYRNSPVPVAMVKWLLRHGWWTYWFSETGEEDDGSWKKYLESISFEVKNPQPVES